MVGAGLELVGLAAGAVADVEEVFAGDNTCLGHPLHGSSWLATCIFGIIRRNTKYSLNISIHTTTSHAHTAGKALAAASSVLGGELDVFARRDAAAILEGLGGAESLKAASQNERDTQPRRLSIHLPSMNHMKIGHG